MDEIKKAFQRVREDMDILRQEISFLKENLVDLSEILSQVASTQQQEKQTDSGVTSTHNHPLEPLKPQYLPISTGNEGVPTDKQTNRQTNRHTPISYGTQSFDEAAEILASLDNIKKEIRLKFKRLTDQELLVFSTIYQLEEETEQVDYRVISERLGLTESSIRDYVGRLIKKGIPVEKKKLNNKYIRLSISANLKKVATLPTILQLRGL